MICQSAQPGKILISQQSYNTLKSKVNSLSFSEQVIDNSGQTMTCYSIHKRKNVKRLDKKERERLARDNKAQMAAKEITSQEEAEE